MLRDCYSSVCEVEVQTVLRASLVTTPEEAVGAAIGARRSRSQAPERENPMSSSEVTLIVRLEAKPGLDDRLRQEIMAVLDRIRSEPSCTRFELLQARDDPATFLVQETWKSEKALEQNLRSTLVTDWCTRCRDLMAGEAEICRWYPVV